MRADLREIVKADNARRAKREQAELIELAERYYGQTPEGVDPYHYSRSISGTPNNHNRNVKGTENCWTTRYQIITDSNGNTHAQRVGSVRCVGSDITVIKDGVVTEVPATHFRRPRTTTSKRAASVQNAQQAQRLALLQSCGNATELADGDC